MPKSRSGWALAYSAISTNQGQGTMILAEETIPFSIASIVPMLAEWDMPASSPWMIRYRAAGGGVVSPAGAERIDRVMADRIKQPADRRRKERMRFAS